MFGWGQKGRIARGVKELHAGTAPERVLDAAKPHDRLPLALAGMKALMFDDQHAQAVALVEATLKRGIEDEEVLLAAEGVYTVTGDSERALELCERALSRNLESPRLLSLLATRLTQADRAPEALELLNESGCDALSLQIPRAEALFALDRNDEAIRILEGMIEVTAREMQRAVDASQWTTYRDLTVEAESLLHAAQAEQHGAESVIGLAIGRRDLAKVGSNYRLMAESLMVDSDYHPDSTALEAPQATLARVGERPTPRAEESASLLALRGCAWLRLGKIDLARAAFDAACERDGQFFAGYRGLGAVLDEERYELRRRATMLPELRCPASVAEVVVDWSALTPLEQQVVVASVYPLRGALPHLIESAAKIHLLPIDVRTVDLPAWQQEAGSRFEDDHRALDALGGVASSEHQLAAARIEELLDVESEQAFIFGHEFAHLAYFRMPDTSGVEALYARACAVPYVASSYQMSNEHEFFACAYQDYLRQRYQLRTYREADDQGVWDSVVKLFDDLAHRDVW